MTASAMVELSPAQRLERLGTIDYPTKRNEAWRYAPHGALGQLVFGGPADVPVDVLADLDDRLPVVDGPRIVMINGVVDPERSDLDALPAGVRLASLASIGDSGNADVGAHFDGDAAAADAFTALNIAYGGDGAFLQIDAGHHVDNPIHIVDIAAPATEQAASCTGVVIVLGEGASATVIETRIGAGTETGGSNVRATITLGQDAQLDHVVLQDLASTHIHLGRVEATQGAGSELRARSFNLGGAYGRVAYDVQLVGEGASADLSGLYFGRGDQTLDQQINVVHDAKNCTSRQAFRGVLDDQSTGVFNGGIDVRPGADGTDAEQSNDNLLLSKRAEVNTQPRLEILADEVACKHGATVGQLDDTALYYLRSRGIPGDQARRLLVNGFADQAVDEVEVEAVQTWIIDRLGHSDA